MYKVYTIMCNKVLIHKSYGNIAVCSLARNRPRIKYSQVSSFVKNGTKAQKVHLYFFWLSGAPLYACIM